MRVTRVVREMRGVRVTHVVREMRVTRVVRMMQGVRETREVVDCGEDGWYPDGLRASQGVSSGVYRGGEKRWKYR